MSDERRRPYVNQVELLALAKEFNQKTFPRRMPNAAYLLAYLAYVDDVVEAKRALENGTR